MAAANRIILVGNDSNEEHKLNERDSALLGSRFRTVEGQVRFRRYELGARSRYLGAAVAYVKMHASAPDDDHREFDDLLLMHYQLEDLRELTKVADYMGVRSLVELLASKLAHKIRGAAGRDIERALGRPPRG